MVVYFGQMAPEDRRIWAVFYGSPVAGQALGTSLEPGVR